MKEKKLYEKTYIVKKGQYDYRVWSRANDYIFNFIVKKRNHPYRAMFLKKPITVKIEIVENKS